MFLFIDYLSSYYHYYHLLNGESPRLSIETSGTSSRKTAVWPVHQLRISKLGALTQADSSF